MKKSRKTTTTCLHCGAVCVPTFGRELFTSKKLEYLAEEVFHVCPLCPDSRVGSHQEDGTPLGFAANRETRQARMKLHKEMLDPIWMGKTRMHRREARTRIYEFLSYRMDLREAHVGEFTLEQCREAWLILSNETFKSICDFLEDAKA